MPRVFILFLTLAVTISTTAQNNYAVRLYSTDNGLPSNGVKGLQWDDETGFLWIATEAGVVRFNGIDFKNFTNENTPALTSERMLFLVRNFEGSILTSDQETNIFCVKKNRLALYNGYPRKGNKTGN